MTPITIISKHRSERLDYVLNWLFNTVFQTGYIIVLPEQHNGNGFTIGYGVRGTITVPDGGLLWETGIKPQPINTGEWNGVPTIYNNVDGGENIPFDLFSAVFFLLSRYEEYYSYTPDKYERYPAEQSILHQNGWLMRPLVDEWVWELYQLLTINYRLSIPFSSFHFTPTYDIDIAYSYKHKGLKRTAGALVRDLLQGNIGMVADRLSVFRGAEADPYDCFDWLQGKHESLGLHPVYFILAALHTTPYDKNIDPRSETMRQLIKKLAAEGETGMHPSYYSGDEKKFEAEKKLLEQYIGRAVTNSRQHYIRLRLPHTYRDLIARGIAEDFSMGYGAKLGFRAGTGRSFYWYDLEQEKQTSLLVHPFCFMDSTARFEEGLDAMQAKHLLLEIMSVLKNTHSQMITVFHNFSLGTDAGWKDWNNMYASFLEEVSGNEFIVAPTS